MSSQVDSDLRRHLLQHYDSGHHQEDLCFALWRPSKGRTRTTALIYQAILPEAGDRELTGNVSFTPQYFERALCAAAAENAGLAFLHSHPFPGWQDMSRDDVAAENRLAPRVQGATGFPVVGLTLGTDGAWSARFWERIAPRRYERRWCGSVRVVGERLGVTFMDKLAPPPAPREELTRTISAWGEETQARIARLRVGVIGVGSVGDAAAEGLVRTGFEDVMLMDFDSIERVNRDRMMHATQRDIGRLKVEVTAERLRENAVASPFHVEEIPLGITDEDGFRAALDCDVLISCVDKPWGRSVMNFIAYAHLIPVIDGGISVRVNERGLLRGADWKAHTIAAGRRCMECLGQYLPTYVTLERDGYLEDPEYIKGLPKTHTLRRNENVFAFSMSTASFQLLQLLNFAIAPAGVADVGAQTYHFVTGTLDTAMHEGCLQTCPYPDLVAQGDHSTIVVTGKRKPKP